MIFLERLVPWRDFFFEEHAIIINKKSGRKAKVGSKHFLVWLDTGETQWDWGYIENKKVEPKITTKYFTRE